MNKRIPRRLSVLTAAFLLCLSLLAGCGGTAATADIPGTETAIPAESGIFTTSDGYWTTDGNVWYATNGDVAWYATYGNVWYATNGDAWSEEGIWYATDGNVGVSAPYIDYATDGNAVPMHTVNVSTVDELLAALAPDTEIVLAPGEYDLNSAEPALYRYCYWKPLGYTEGSQLILSNLSNTVIRSASGESADVSIIASPMEVNVLTFENCYQVRLSGVTVGHGEAERSTGCTGNVIYIDNCWSVYIGGCDLYGCGYLGVQAYNSTSVTVEDSVIHDCSGGGVDFYGCQSVFISGCTFTRSGEYQTLSFMYCDWALVNECTFTGNRSMFFLSSNYCSNVSLVRCSMDNCSYTTLYDIYGDSVQQNGFTIGDDVFLGGSRYYG